MGSMRHPQRLQWVLPQSRHPGMSAEEVNAWDTHQNKVWWQKSQGECSLNSLVVGENKWLGLVHLIREQEPCGAVARETPGHMSARPAAWPPTSLSCSGSDSVVTWTVPTGSWQRSARWPRLLSAWDLGGGGRKGLQLGALGGGVEGGEVTLELGSQPSWAILSRCVTDHVASPLWASPSACLCEVGQSDWYKASPSSPLWSWGCCVARCWRTFWEGALTWVQDPARHGPMTQWPHCPESAPDRGGWVISSHPPWIPRVQTTGSRPGGWWAGDQPRPESLLSSQYEKILKLTMDARFGEHPTGSTDLWVTLGTQPGAWHRGPSSQPALTRWPQQRG